MAPSSTERTKLSDRWRRRSKCLTRFELLNARAKNRVAVRCSAWVGGIVSRSALHAPLRWNCKTACGAHTAATHGAATITLRIGSGPCRLPKRSANPAEKTSEELYDREHETSSGSAGFACTDWFGVGTAVGCAMPHVQTPEANQPWTMVEVQTNPSVRLELRLVCGCALSGRHLRTRRKGVRGQDSERPKLREPAHMKATIATKTPPPASLKRVVGLPHVGDEYRHIRHLNGEPGGGWVTDFRVLRVGKRWMRVLYTDCGNRRRKMVGRIWIREWPHYANWWKPNGPSSATAGEGGRNV